MMLSRPMITRYRSVSPLGIKLAIGIVDNELSNRVSNLIKGF